jgi:putative transposase
MLKRERVNRRRYYTRAEARSDIFDYIERFYNPRMRRKLQRIENKEIVLNSSVR